MNWMRKPNTLVEDGIISGGADFMSAAVANLDEKRSPALVEVLCKLPQQEYETIKESEIWFFTPHYKTNGWNGRIPQGKKQMVYLSPFLERDIRADGVECSREDRMLIIAHEVAHAILGHTDKTPTMEIEDEAWRKVEELGFGTTDQIQELRRRMGA